MSARLEMRELDTLAQAEAERVEAAGGVAALVEINGEPLRSVVVAALSAEQAAAWGASGREAERWRRALIVDGVQGWWPEWRRRCLSLALNGEYGGEAEHCAGALLADDVRAARLEWLWMRAGITPAVAMLMCLGVARMASRPDTGGCWEPTDTPDAWGRAPGTRVITMPITDPQLWPVPIDAVGTLTCTDILAVDPARPSWWATRHGTVDALPDLRSACFHLDGAIQVHPHPLAWLQAGCTGMVALTDAALEPHRLAGKTLVCASPKHANALAERVEAMRDAVLPPPPRYKVVNKARGRENEREAA